MAAAAGASRRGVPSGESIYNWIKVEPDVPVKPKMYRSKFSAKKTEIAYTTLKPAKVKKAAATMGRSVKDTVNPKKFLRRGEKMPRAPDPRSIREDFCVCQPLRLDTFIRIAPLHMRRYAHSID